MFVVLPIKMNMILPDNLEYYSESDSNPPHASSYPSQYLGVTQSSNSTSDSDGSQPRKSSFAADRDPKWFTDFILYDSEDPATEADAMSVSKTSTSVTVDSQGGTSALTLLNSLPESVPQSIEDVVPDNTSLYRWLNSTELDIKDPAVGLDATDINPQRAKEPVLGLFRSTHSESPSGTNSQFSSPGYPNLSQNDVSNKVAVPRMRHYICHTCKHHCSSPSRLREHLQKYHQPLRFICSTCSKGFKAEKDLIRHNKTHESSKRTFACSCTRAYYRLDSLTRHIAQKAEKPTETGRHMPV